MEELFARFADIAGLLVEIVAVLVVAFGAADAFVRLLWIVATPGTPHGARKAIWRRFLEKDLEHAAESGELAVPAAGAGELAPRHG